MVTALETRLTDDLKTAMRARDKVGLAAIRMLRTRFMELRTAKNARELDEEGAVALVRAYAKSLTGAVAEFVEKGTPEDDDNVAGLRAEIAFLDRYLPQMLDEAATAAIVAEVIAAHEITDPKMTGKAIGLVMKDHKGKADPGLVGRLVRAKLAG